MVWGTPASLWIVKLADGSSASAYAVDAVQAETILARDGKAVVPGSAVPVTPRGPRQLPPLTCSACRYPLDGLTVRDSAMTCPECGFKQVVIPVRDTARGPGPGVADGVPGGLERPTVSPVVNGRWVVFGVLIMIVAAIVFVAVVFW